MSTVVDERVVSMQFDNKHFEQNVKTSMGTLEKLKQSLQFKGATKGLEEVNAASQKLDFRQIENTACEAGFSIRDVWLKVATVFEYQIARRITNAATSMVKALTIDPVRTGLSEYETQLNAIQTILANTESKGSTLEDVNAALDELNTYADKTIYNFTEMTKNIGTFTAAGVDLDTSVSAIKGIANLAAVSGSTSQQASTAMYQLSQALASGTVKLMDWNSVVNAGMGGQVFQDALKETARVHGIAIDQIIEQQGSFRESLSEGWLTAEILTDTLAKFTGDLSEEQILSMGYTKEQAAEILKLGETANDAATKVKTFTQLMDTLKEAAQSGWSQTWRLIIGDFEEAKTLWSAASNVFGDIINKSAEARNSLLSGALDSGWDQFLDKGIMDDKGYQHYIQKVAKRHGVAMDQMIKDEGSFEAALRKGLKEGSISADVLTTSLNEMTTAYQNCSDEELKNLGYTREQVKEMALLNAKIQNGTFAIETFTDKISRLSGRELLFSTEEVKRADGMVVFLGAIPNILKAIKSVIEPIKEAFNGKDGIFSPMNSEQLYKLLEGFRNFTQKLILSEDTADKLKRTFKGLFAIIDIALTIVKIFGKAIIKVLSQFKGLGNGILGVTAGLGDFIVGISKALKESKGLGSFADGLANVLIKIITVIKNFAASVKEAFDTSSLSGFVSFIKKVWNVISTIIGKIINAITSVGGALSESIDGSGISVILDLLNAGLLASIFLKIRGLFDGLGNIVDSFNEIMGSITQTLKTFQQSIKASILEKISKAMIMLAAAVLIISLIDKDKLERALAAMTLLFGALIGAMAVFTKIPSAIASGSTLIALSTSLLVLSFALKKLSGLVGRDVITGILAMTAGLGVLIGALTLLSLIKSTRKMATEGAHQLLKITIVLIPLAFALKKLSEMYWGDIARSLVAMVGALGALVGTLTILTLLNSTKKMATEGSKQLLKIAITLLPIAYVLKKLSGMSWAGIAKSMVVMYGALGALVGTLTILTLLDKMSSKMAKEKTINVKLVIGKCAQLTLMAAAIGVLALALGKIAKMGWSDIFKGLGVMVATLTMLLAGMTYISKKIDNLETGKSTAAMLLMALSIKTLSTTLAFLGQLKWSTIAKGLVAMMGAMTILAASAVIMSQATSSMSMLLGDSKSGGLFGLKKEAAMVKTAASLIVMALAIKVLASSLFLLGQMKWSTIAKGLTAIAGVMVVLAVSAKFIGLAATSMTSIAGAIALLGLACLAAGAGIALMATGFSMLTESVGDAINALCQALINSAGSIGQAISALLVNLLDALVKVSDKLAVSLLTIILNTLSTLSQFAPEMVKALVDLIIGVIDELINFIPEIVNVGVKFLSTLFKAITDVFKTIDSDALFKGSLGLAALAGMVLMLSKIAKSIPAALIGALGMVAVVTEIGVLFGLLSKIPGLSDLIGSGGEILQSIGSAIGMFIGGLLAGLSSGFVGGAKNAATIIQTIGTPENIIAMGLIAALMIAVSKLSGSVGNTALSGIKIGIMISELGLIFAAIGALSKIPGLSTGIQNGAEIIKQMGSAEVITSLGLISGLMFILSKVNGSIKNTALNGANLAIMVGELGVIFLAIGALANIPGLGNSLDKGIEIIKKMGSPAVILSLGLMAALMLVLSLMSGSVVSALLGTAGLAAVVTALGLIFAGLGGFKSSIPEGIEVFQMIASAKNILLMGLMAGLMLALSAVAMLTPTALTGVLGMGLVVAELAILLTAMGALYRIPGLMEIIADGGAFLQTIGTAIGQFFGGIVGGIAVGLTSSLPEMGTHFAQFMTNLKPFLDGISGITPEIAQSAKYLATALLTITAADLLESITSWFTGGTSLEDFGNQLGGFGKGISSFITNLGADFDPERVRAGAEAAKYLAEASKSIPKEGGWWQKLVGTKDAGDFGTKLGSFGEGIAAFAKNLGADFDPEKVRVGAEAALNLAKAADQIPTKGGIWKISMEDLKIRLGAFGSAMVTFVTSTSEVTAEDISAVETKINTLNDALSSFSADGVNSVTDEFANSKGKISSAVKSALQSAVDAVKGFNDKIRDAGKKFIEHLSKGIKDKEKGVKTSLTTIVNNASSAIHSRTYYDDFYDVGVYLVEGFADGIDDTAYAAETAATAMANAAKKAAEEALGVESPSKVFYQIGAFTGEGFITALNDYEVKSASAGSNLGESAVKGIQNIISKVKNLIENGIDSQPTIRPVLDLSEVTAGANAINGMLDMSPSMGVMARVSSISEAMNKNQNGVDNSDIISAIKNLETTIGENTGDSYYFGDVKVDNGSEVEAAFATIARAAKMSGRR